MVDVDIGGIKPLATSLRSLRYNLLAWYQEGAAPWPWRQNWAKHKDPYHVWLSEIMLQQTVINAALPKYQSFLELFPSVEDLALATENDVKLACSGLGYYRRFGLMHKAAKLLVATGSPIQWPTCYDEWLELPGIGPYTAAAVSSIVLGSPHAVVDGNVERVLCRLLDIRLPVNMPKLKPIYQDRADALLVREAPGDFNQAVMELGQTVCKVGEPLCGECPLADGCLSKKAKSQHLAPGPKIKKSSVGVKMRLVIPTNGRQLGLMKRPHKAKFLKDTLGFPTFIRQGRFFRGDGFDVDLDWKHGEKLGTFKHGITNHKIEAEVWGMPLSHLQGLLEFQKVGKKVGKSRLISSLDSKGLDIGLKH